MANLSFNDCSTLLASINAQATGRAGITPTNTAEFVSVAQATLHTGYDSVINAISTVLSKTIFSVRPYARKFAGITANEIRYGNHVRKLSVVDSDPEADRRQKLEHGKSVDMQTVNKPTVVQTNFYSANTYQRHITLFKDQLDVAFSSPSEFAAFVSMVVQHVSDEIEKDHESCARFTLANFIGGKLAAASVVPVANDPEKPGSSTIASASGVVHLITEYNAKTGANVTAATVRKPENFPAFMKFVIARIRTISELMTERSTMFHTSLTGKPISRHTPLNKQKVYLYAPDVHDMEASVFSGVYHDEYLKKVDFETVNFWQSINDPTTVNINATYMTETGQLATVAVNNAAVFGVIFDEEALGYTVVNQWSAPAPFNASGGYTNVFHHFTDRYWNDFTENGVVLLLD